MPLNIKKVRILGARIFAQEVADLMSDCEDMICTGFVENLDRELCDKPISDLEVIWVDDLEGDPDDTHIICGLGTNKRSQYVKQVKPFGKPFVTLIHPTAYLSKSSTIGEGTILGVNSVVASHTTLGNHVIVNRSATIGHHTTIGDYVTISPQANIAGACSIGDKSYIALGATIIDRVTIGAGAIVGAGAVVTKDVAPGDKVMGIPARVVDSGLEGR